MKFRLLKYALLFAVLMYGGFSKQQLYFSSAQAKPTPREVKLQKYLFAKGSTMAKDASFIIKTADYYHLDYALIVSIAGVESGFETAGNIYDNNPFGIMCSGSPCYFKSMREAITYEAKLLSRGSAYTTFRQTGKIIDLAKVYNQVSPEDWTSKILFFEKTIKN